MSLDIAEPQVLVQYPGERPEWQQFILLRRLRDATWVVLSTERQVEVLDLGQHTLIPLGRGTAIPGIYAARCVFFDVDVEEHLPAYHAQAARLAAILGGPTEPAAGAGPAACWRVADTAAPDFGMEVADELVESAASGVIKGAVGLARCGEPPRWIFVERVPLAEVGAWEQDKQSGAGRDRRLGVPRAHLAGAQTLQLGEAVTGWRPRDLRELPDWPHQGPRAISEFVQAILTLGLNLFTYHEFWVRQSGVHAESSVSWEHRMLCSTLALAISYDRLDATNNASLELAARRIIMIERAVRVNSKSPSFVGLHKMIEHSLDEGGGIATREFTAHMATLAEAEARILKQNRLLREELDHKKKSEDGKGGGKDRKKKEGDGGAGGGQP